MSNDRKVMVREDRDGKLFVKYRVFKNHWLILRPHSEDKDSSNYTFKKGEKVRAFCLNEVSGYFMIALQGKSESRAVWRGPCWVAEKFKGEWIGEQLKI